MTKTVIKFRIFPVSKFEKVVALFKHIDSSRRVIKQAQF